MQAATSRQPTARGEEAPADDPNSAMAEIRPQSLEKPRKIQKTLESTYGFRVGLNLTGHKHLHPGRSPDSGP
jgi:hypothetical protein